MSRVNKVDFKSQNSQFDEVGKLNIGYAKNDNSRALIHHGAHSQSIYQMMKYEKDKQQNKSKAKSIENNSVSSKVLSHTSKYGHLQRLDMTGPVTQPQQQSQMIQQIISSALDRKQISQSFYSQAYPAFLQSQGPYKIYDHAAAKGKQYVANLQSTNNQAHLRFQHEINLIKEARETEKDNFYISKDNQDYLASTKQQLKLHNHRSNLEFIQQQIDIAKAKKREFEYREKQYYKPHFGPEETDALLEQELLRRSNQKHFVKSHLKAQMSLKQNMTQVNVDKERNGDIENLQLSLNHQMAEEMAK